MSSFKLVVDILSSVAAIFAISAVLYSWRVSKKSPIKVVETVISREDVNKHRIILRIENIKPYPVTIKSLVCFSRSPYRIEKRPMQRPKIKRILSVKDRVFGFGKELTISELGEERSMFYVSSDISNISQLIFLVDTSHGFIRMQCKNIKYFQGSEVFSPDILISKEKVHSSFVILIRAYLVYLIDLLPFKARRLRAILLPKDSL